MHTSGILSNSSARMKPLRPRSKARNRLYSTSTSFCDTVCVGVRRGEIESNFGGAGNRMCMGVWGKAGLELTASVAVVDNLFHVVLRQAVTECLCVRVLKERENEKKIEPRGNSRFSGFRTFQAGEAVNGQRNQYQVHLCIQKRAFQGGCLARYREKTTRGNCCSISTYLAHSESLRRF